jgi:nitrilase
MSSQLNNNTITVAVVQAGTVLFDNDKTLQKLQSLANEAAQKGARLIVFPEAFIGGYPKGFDFGARLGTRSDDGRDQFRRYFDCSITDNGREASIIAQTARSLSVYLVVGIIERDQSTLYCSVLIYGPNGRLLGKHRKLMPTALERLVWGCGDGSMLPVVDSDIGRIGAVICWENYMPLLRTTMYAKGIQLYCAPTVDDRDVWLPTMQMIALEGRCFVLSACQFMTSADFPVDHQAYANGNQRKTLIRGGSCIIDPFGKVLLVPSFDGERIGIAEIDIGQITRGKYDLDVVGHYARSDIFQLHVNEHPQASVIFKSKSKM